MSKGVWEEVPPPHLTTYGGERHKFPSRVTPLNMASGASIQQIFFGKTKEAGIGLSYSHALRQLITAAVQQMVTVATANQQASGTVNVVN